MILKRMYAGNGAIIETIGTDIGYLDDLRI